MLTNSSYTPCPATGSEHVSGHDEENRSPTTSVVHDQPLEIRVQEERHDLSTSTAPLSGHTAGGPLPTVADHEPRNGSAPSLFGQITNNPFQTIAGIMGVTFGVWTIKSYNLSVAMAKQTIIANKLTAITFCKDDEVRRTRL